MDDHSGDDIYKITDPAADQTITDWGGVNTLDLSKLKQGAIINTDIGDDVVLGGGGKIHIDFPTAFNFIIGTKGDDLIFGSEPTQEIISGGKGNDKVALTGGDFLTGFGKGDTLFADGDFSLRQLSKQEVTDLGFLKGKVVEITTEHGVTFANGTEKLIGSIISTDALEQPV